MENETKFETRAERQKALTEDRTTVAWLTPQWRAWLYGVTCAVLAVLAAYKVVEADLVGVWLALASAVLGVATAHTGGVYEAPLHGLPESE